MILAITFGVGFILGMYVVTQLEKGIDKNIKKDDQLYRREEPNG